MRNHLSRDRVDRKFALLDAMILVTATAVGFGLIRTFSPVVSTYPFDPIGPMSDRWGVLDGHGLAPLGGQYASEAVLLADAAPVVVDSDRHGTSPSVIPTSTRG